MLSEESGAAVVTFCALLLQLDNMAYALRTLTALLLAAASVAVGPSSASLADRETVQLMPAERMLAQVPAAGKLYLVFLLPTCN